MQQNNPTKPSFPADRAFVIQLRMEADGTREKWAGRIEHISSGQVGHFRSWEEMRAFVQGILSKVDQNLSDGGSGIP